MAVGSADRHTAGLTTALVLRYVRAQGGDDAVTRMLAVAGETRPAEVLEDETSWSTYQEKIALFEAAAEVLNDPLAARHIGERVLEDKVGAPLKLLLRALGSPGQVLRNVATTAPKFSTVCTMEAPEVSNNRAVITYQLHDGFTPHQMDCDYNIGLLSQVPVLFGLPPADVVHNQCQVRGAGRCVYRLRWAVRGKLPWSSKNRQIRVLEDQLETLAERTEALQSTIADLVSPEEVGTVLARIAQRAATAVRAQAFLLVVQPREGAPMLIEQEGLSATEANRLAREVLRDPTGVEGESNLVTDVASARNSHGYLVAMYPVGHRFFPEERVLLAAYARHAAIALDVALALEAARNREKTASVLLDLARTLSEATTRDEVCERIAEAVPEVSGIERSVVYLYDVSTSSLNVRAVRGYPSDLVPALMSLSFSPENMPVFKDLFEHFELRSYNVETVEDELVREQMQRFGAAETFVAPIMAGDQMLGLVTATRQVGSPPLDPDVNLRERMNGLTDEAALALQKVTLLEQERAAVERLREADRFKSEFLSTVSHELRTPLAAIIGMARTITDRGDVLEDAVKKDFMLAIVKRGEQLERLVGDLLRSSRDVDLDAAPINLTEILEAAASEARGMNPDATVTVDAPEQLPIVCDPGRLRQVLDNLLTNAVKYAPDSPIAIEATRSGEEAVVTVNDKGPGMDDEMVARAFEPFFQGDPGRREEGVGLGLYICRKIVEAHGGSMNLRSTPGAGTAAELRVPVAGPVKESS